LVAGNIEHSRQRVPLPAKQRDQAEGMGKEVVRGDEIDVVYMMVSDHLLHPPSDFVHVYGLPKSITGYLIVLAVGTPKRTSRKEDRSRPRIPWGKDGSLGTES
jgi:hypothetical protein